MGECHINGCENRASPLRLAFHRGICRDNLSLHLAFKAYRRSRSMKPIKEILENILISTALLAIIKRKLQP